MRNLLQSMWDGFGLMKGSGQFLVLFLITVFILLFYKKSEIRELKWYSAVLLLLLLCPFTAKLLLLYQTAYYGYADLWLLLPVTLLIAYMLTITLPVCLNDIPVLKKMTESGKRSLAEVICIFMMMVLLFLCGTMKLAEEKTQRTDYGDVFPAETEEVLHRLPLAEGETLTVLAPDEIAGYLRSCDGRILLPYGRFLWEEELNAYTYDTYAADVKEMHDWVNGTLIGMDEIEISENYLSICTSRDFHILIFEKERLQKGSLSEALDKQDSYRYFDETEHYVIYRLYRSE
ncbi:MAG: hypothetical protein ACI4SA_06640 [Lachnospiraceae bacterium]